MSESGGRSSRFVATRPRSPASPASVCASRSGAFVPRPSPRPRRNRRCASMRRRSGDDAPDELDVRGPRVGGGARAGARVRRRRRARRPPVGQGRPRTRDRRAALGRARASSSGTRSSPAASRTRTTAPRSRTCPDGTGCVTHPRRMRADSPRDTVGREGRPVPVDDQRSRQIGVAHAPSSSARPVLAALSASILVPLAQAASPDAVISQVYAGGGNAGASYTNDFVELFNRGGTAVDLTGWTVQYASAASTSWQATALAGSIAPGRHYLVQLGSTAAVGSALPDAGRNRNDEPGRLGRQGGARPERDRAHLWRVGGQLCGCRCRPGRVRIGRRLRRHRRPRRRSTATTADVRASGGCTDTDVNSADFAALAPAPKNSTVAASCLRRAPVQTGGVDADRRRRSRRPAGARRSRSSERASRSARRWPAPRRARSLSASRSRATTAPGTRSPFIARRSRLPISRSGSRRPPRPALSSAQGSAAVWSPIPVAPAADLVVGNAGAATGRKRRRVAGDGRVLGAPPCRRLGQVRRHGHLHGDSAVIAAVAISAASALASALDGRGGRSASARALGVADTHRRRGRLVVERTRHECGAVERRGRRRIRRIRSRPSRPATHRRGGGSAGGWCSRPGGSRWVRAARRT